MCLCATFCFSLSFSPFSFLLSLSLLCSIFPSSIRNIYYSSQISVTTWTFPYCFMIHLPITVIILDIVGFFFQFSFVLNFFSESFHIFPFIEVPIPLQAFFQVCFHDTSLLFETEWKKTETKTLLIIPGLWKRVLCSYHGLCTVTNRMAFAMCQIEIMAHEWSFKILHNEFI